MLEATNSRRPASESSVEPYLFQMPVDASHTIGVEAELDEQQERFAFATRAARIGYWFCNLPFDRLEWDETVKEHFWLPPEAQVTIDLFYAIIHPDDREPTRRAMEVSISNQSLYDVEYRTIAADGRFKWIRAIGRTAYAEDGSPIRFDGVTQDITELKLAQQALDAERARLSAVFENVPVGIIFVLKDGSIASANPQVEEILGRSMAQLAFRDVPFFHEDGSLFAESERPLGRVFAEGGTHRAEFQYRRPDGTMIWVDATASPILDVNGKIAGAVGTLTDIDVRKRAELALIRNEKLALVGRLAASISHEINNPLEAVINLLYLIENNSADEVIRGFSCKAQEELARVSHIVTHTLRFNRQSLGWGSHKLSELLESSAALYEGRLKNSDILPRREYRDAMPIQCAGSELRQVFANIVGNAFDALRRGGKLVLRCVDQRHPRTGQPGVRVSIGDSGQGIPSSIRSHLFEPFFTTKGDNGTGLGLWVSREILSKHRAEIRVKSSTCIGKSGTVFSIWFPAES